MILGLGFALIPALGTNLSGLFKARGRGGDRPTHPGAPSGAQRRRSVSLTMVRGRMDPRAVRLGPAYRSARARPLSTVQAVLSGGLVFLAILAERFFRFHLG